MGSEEKFQTFGRFANKRHILIGQPDGSAAAVFHCRRELCGATDRHDPCFAVQHSGRAELGRRAAETLRESSDHAHTGLVGIDAFRRESPGMTKALDGA